MLSRKLHNYFLIGVFDRRGLFAKIVACCLSSLIACAGAAPKHPVLPSIEPGQSYAQVAAQTHTARRLPAFEFVAGAHQMALFYVDEKGVLSDSVNASALPTVMLFEDDGYLGALSANLALAFDVCLDKPAGPELLAERLRMLVAGKPDPFVATSRAADGPSPCPSGLRPPPPEPERKHSEFWHGVGEGLFYSAGIILSPFILAIGTPILIGGALQDQRALGQQSGLRLGDSATDIVHLMGEPDHRFQLTSAGTEVLCYNRSFSPPLYIGLQGERLIWLRWSLSNWLTAIKAQLEQDRKSSAGNNKPSK
jgi:hypothetical protein